MNVINQSVIGTKEGIVEAVSKPVSSDITDAILRTADGSDFKSIDDYTLYEVMKVAIDGADRPTTNDVLEQLLEVINHPFDMKLMQSNAARMTTYEICCHLFPNLFFGDTPLMQAFKSNFFASTSNVPVQLVVLNRWPSTKRFHFTFLMEKPHFV